jgi:hypothetical protein
MGFFVRPTTSTLTFLATTMFCVAGTKQTGMGGNTIAGGAPARSHDQQHKAAKEELINYDAKEAGKV